MSTPAVLDVFGNARECVRSNARGNDSVLIGAVIEAISSEDAYTSVTSLQAAAREATFVNDEAQRSNIRDANRSMRLAAIGREVQTIVDACTTKFEGALYPALCVWTEGDGSTTTTRADALDALITRVRAARVRIQRFCQSDYTVVLDDRGNVRWQQPPEIGTFFATSNVDNHKTRLAVNAFNRHPDIDDRAGIILDVIQWCASDIEYGLASVNALLVHDEDAVWIPQMCTLLAADVHALLAAVGAIAAHVARIDKGAYDAGWAFASRFAVLSATVVLSVNGCAKGLLTEEDLPGLRHNSHRPISLAPFGDGASVLRAARMFDFGMRCLLLERYHHRPSMQAMPKLCIAWQINTGAVLRMFGVESGADVEPPESPWWRNIACVNRWKHGANGAIDLVYTTDSTAPLVNSRGYMLKTKNDAREVDTRITVLREERTAHSIKLMRNHEQNVYAYATRHAVSHGVAGFTLQRSRQATSAEELVRLLGATSIQG